MTCFIGTVIGTIPTYAFNSSEEIGKAVSNLAKTTKILEQCLKGIPLLKEEKQVFAGSFAGIANILETIRLVRVIGELEDNPVTNVSQITSLFDRSQEDHDDLYQ